MIEQGRQKKRGVSLDVLKPERDGDRWKSVAIVSVSGTEENPEVIIFKNGARVETLAADDDGKTTTDIFFDAPGEYLITANVEDRSVSKRVQVSKDREVRKPAARLDIYYTDGTLFVGVYDAGGHPKKGVAVNLISEVTLEGVIGELTDEDGRCVLRPRFEEQSALIAVTADTCFREILLSGPLHDNAEDGFAEEEMFLGEMLGI